MTKKELLALIRRLIADEQATGFSEGGNMEEPEGTQELLNYFDRAIDEYSKRQADSQDLRLVKRMAIINGATIPDDFLHFCGSVPVTVEGKKLFFYGEPAMLTIKYFARLPYITEFSDEAELPYEHDQCIKLAAIAAIFALNKHEYNVSQDLLLLGYGNLENAYSQQQAQ